MAKMLDQFNKVTGFMTELARKTGIALPDMPPADVQHSDSGGVAME
jgi:hypothetical protein